MRKFDLLLPLVVALAMALITMSCGKEKKTSSTGSKKSSGSSSKSKSNNKGSKKSADGGNIIAGGQIVVIKDIVFKSGDLTAPYTGLVIWKHKNGKRKREGYCEGGIWNGPTKWWYESEVLAGEGTYKIGEWDGDYKEWHENGKQKVQVTFRDGKEEGREIWWYENGQIRSITSHKAGKKEGKAEGFFESGVKSWEAGWTDDFPDGEYTEWYLDGSKKSVMRYVKRARHGLEEHWYSRKNKSQKEQKSREITWFKNKKHGVERHWYPTGLDMKAMTYKNGVLNGQAASWYQSGKQASQRVFTDGKETYRRQWDQNGKLLVDGPVRQANQPRGRTHQWTQKTITDYCKGKTAAEIEADFGKADGAGPGGTWVYRGIQVQNPKTKQYIAANIYFTIQAGKVVNTKVTAK
jgi:antitoxin component YwqK of YwqJK toxin-antitoxin module